jgi:hypothetical protein
MELLIDPARQNERMETGFFVRAKLPNGAWESVDIVKLDRASLWLWLTSLTPDGARRTVLALLGHDHTATELLPRVEEKE